MKIFDYIFTKLENIRCRAMIGYIQSGSLLSRGADRFNI